VVAIGVLVVSANALVRPEYGYTGFVWGANGEVLPVRYVWVEEFDSVAIWTTNADVSLLNEAKDTGFVRLELDVGSGPERSSATLVGDTKELQRICRIAEENMADRIEWEKKRGYVPPFLVLPYRSMDLPPGPVLHFER
jgi:hypothetical protein